MAYTSKYTGSEIDSLLDELQGVDSLLDEINGASIEIINEINGEVI